MKYAKTFALALCALATVSFVTQAQARFGTTYAASCKTWGGKGEVNSTTRTIFWSVPDTTKSYTWVIEEQYKDNYCSMICYHTQGPVSEGLVWQILTKETYAANQTWHEMAMVESGVRDFYLSNSARVIATVWTSSEGIVHIRVTTDDWLKRHNLVRTPGGEDSKPPPPPVQEFNA